MAMELEITWPRVMRIWWAWCWRSFVGGILGFLVYSGLRLAVKSGPGGVTGLDRRSVVLANFAFELAIGLVISVLALKWVIGKDFGEFRLVLLEWRKDGYLQEPATWLRALQLWWSLTWRNAVAAAGVYIGSFFLALFNYDVSVLAAGLPAALFRFFSISVLVVLCFAIGLIPLKLVLQKEFRDFHLALLPKSPPPDL
jgi:hypothetical protein